MILHGSTLLTAKRLSLVTSVTGGPVPVYSPDGFRRAARGWWALLPPGRDACSIRVPSLGLSAGAVPFSAIFTPIVYHRRRTLSRGRLWFSEPGFRSNLCPNKKSGGPKPGRRQKAVFTESGSEPPCRRRGQHWGASEEWKRAPEAPQVRRKPSSQSPPCPRRIPPPESGGPA